MATITIMPINRPMVLKSMPRIACFLIENAEHDHQARRQQATMARLTFSLMTTT
jgi:hypothetical protein